MPDPTVTAARHSPEVTTERLMCGDGFERDFWRPICVCGWRGDTRLYRSQALADSVEHVQEEFANARR